MKECNKRKSPVSSKLHLILKIYIPDFSDDGRLPAETCRKYHCKLTKYSLIQSSIVKKMCYCLFLQVCEQYKRVLLKHTNMAVILDISVASGFLRINTLFLKIGMSPVELLVWRILKLSITGREEEILCHNTWADFYETIW
jgi:hypothetical protein